VKNSRNKEADDSRESRIFVGQENIIIEKCNNVPHKLPDKPLVF
jgi:hypothetical protein